MFVVGLVMTGNLALQPTMMQQLMGYPAFTTGVLTAPRAVGVMIAMFVVARMVGRVDNRLIIMLGFLMTATAMWQMTQFTLNMGPAPIVISGLVQGFGLGCTFVPLNLVALSTLPRQILTQATAIRSLMRNLGGSIGISVLIAVLTENTQIVHSRLVEGLRPDNPLAHAPFLSAPFSLTSPTGIAALNHEVTRQAAMVAYINDFKLMMIIVLCSLPLLLLLHEKPVPVPIVPVPAAAEAAADD
jgi:DHA2 family multidrug resistance protein